MGHSVSHALAVHVLSLDNDGASIGLRLLGLFQCGGRDDVSLAVGSSSRAVDAQDGCTHVLHIDAEGLILSIVRLARQAGIMSGKVGNNRLSQLAGRF